MTIAPGLRVVRADDFEFMIRLDLFFPRSVHAQPSLG
jgi:hypothetical protein